ncbi:MAG: hypothetical protein ACKOT0_03755 [bacterium]
MSLSLTGDSGCGSLGHLYRVDPEDETRKTCIACGHVQVSSADPDAS